MQPTKAPQAAATRRSRSRLLNVFWPSAAITSSALSHRPAQYARPKLDDGHNVKQQNQRTERERDRYRTVSSPAQLLWRERDTGCGFVVTIIHQNWSAAHAPEPPNRTCPNKTCTRFSTSITANSMNR